MGKITKTRNDLKFCNDLPCNDLYVSTVYILRHFSNSGLIILPFNTSSLQIAHSNSLAIWDTISSYGTPISTNQNLYRKTSCFFHWFTVYICRVIYVFLVVIYTWWVRIDPGEFSRRLQNVPSYMTLLINPFGQQFSWFNLD